MEIYLYLDTSNRVTGWGTTKGKDADVSIDVPLSHEVLSNPFVFKYENGQLVKDTDYQEQLLQEYQNAPTMEQKLTLLQQAVADLILGGQKNG